ncbi:PP2C family protein-serine/threonine phosphatase [Actinosynnema sp. NPDC047251]|uniref:PPM-type phosphatase domain-containing protein n=1 Tax=Saccharothrix espanaensis (strain ATCC 51144 / DSM 44229 / JCM 9112 / NBRC 15066 / NRRL 15764) TaxID=1179773 RepID=K0K1U3_SACES|nr:PP2C family protein-serine/threonine phosphatase [Saccharothrix espanaensis]CCH32311.1 hypothetical protein BN6_50440 [Saccharothrix espanaensis DSM 44229]
MNDEAHRPEQRAADQQRSAALAVKHAGLSPDDLWVRYFALGGGTNPATVDDYVHGRGALPALERDVLALAVNERLDELTSSYRATYSRPSSAARPRPGLFAALVKLLEGAQSAAPDRLPAVAEAAGRVLGVGLTLYLVDSGRRRLHAVAAGGRRRASLDVDRTVAGRAFREVRALPGDDPESRALWVPLVDGAERLGVLEVEVEHVDDLEDPELHSHCRWFSALLGHLVSLLSQYGDVIDRGRVQVRRSVDAELIRSLLPPSTAGVDGLVVAAALEPRDDVTSDVFDYTLSESTATVIVLDAASQDGCAGPVAAAAVAAYRSARHAGFGLYDQAKLIDETISGRFGGSACATAVLAEFDLVTGRLRYLNAGHPLPLVVCPGKAVDTLDGGRCRPLGLGLGLGEVRIGERALAPEDWVVLYTDGVTTARDAAEVPFGEERLADFLSREVTGAHPVPETVRRLVNAVRDHQHGALRDDVTVLLARRTDPARTTPWNGGAR